MDISKIDQLANANTLAEALKAWLAISSPKNIQSVEDLRCALSLDIVTLEKIVSKQINQVIAHPEFKALEASWRSIHMIVFQPKTELLKVKLFNVSWAELQKDVCYQLEFDLSYLFRKVYSQEYDMPGGEPYGLLIGDYYVRIQGEGAYRDLEILRGISKVAAAAFAPFITGLDPQSLQMQSFTEINPRIHFEKQFKLGDYEYWHDFRQHDESRYVGLTFPRFLLRQPHDSEKLKSKGFYFREYNPDDPMNNFLWGNASYGFASVVIQSFTDYHWFANMRGINPEDGTGGLVRGATRFMPIEEHSPFMPLYSTEVIIENTVNWHLSNQGLMPLCSEQLQGFPFYQSTRSTHRPQLFDKDIATVNDMISSDLIYLMQACRFAHYIKVIMRDAVGSLMQAGDIESKLNGWINKYIASNDVSGVLSYQYPLRNAKVDVKAVPGKPGAYTCTMYLLPRLYTTGIDVDIKLSTEQLKLAQVVAVS